MALCCSVPSEILREKEELGFLLLFNKSMGYQAPNF